MIGKRILPEHWEVRRLDEVGEIVSGGTPSTKEQGNWGEEIIWITPSDLTGYQSKTICKGKKSISRIGLLRSSARMMPKGSVLFSSRAPIGYVVIAGAELCTNQGFKSVIPNEKLISDFLYYFLKFSKSHVQSVASGTTFKEISGKAFASLKMPVPPISDQLKIVEKIEELFSELDAGRRQLETVKEQLKRYRQAVLKWAFEGRFTKKWVIEGEMPKSWEWRELSTITDKITDGTHFTPKYITRGVPFISVKDIKGGKVHFDNCKYIEAAEHDLLKKRCYPEKGDILMTKSGTIGRLALVPDKEFSLFVSVALIKMKNRANNINSKWLIYFLEHHISNLDIKSKVKGGVIKNYHIEDLKQVRIPLCPFNEQNLMVQEIESRLSVCDKIEKTIEFAVKQTESLKQSILKQAFEGKLV